MHPRLTPKPLLGAVERKKVWAGRDPPAHTGAVCFIPAAHPCVLGAGSSGAKGRVKAAGGSGDGLQPREMEPPASLLLGCSFRGVKSVLHRPRFNLCSHLPLEISFLDFSDLLG